MDEYKQALGSIGSPQMDEYKQALGSIGLQLGMGDFFDLREVLPTFHKFFRELQEAVPELRYAAVKNYPTALKQLLATAGAVDYPTPSSEPNSVMRGKCPCGGPEDHVPGGIWCRK